MKYPIAERFKSIQGEGVYTGTPMAFIRFVGCSVGKGVCTHCDTDFESMRGEAGGGLYTASELVEWIRPYHHVCFTGGEPLDRDLSELYEALYDESWIDMMHIETSGTRPIPLWVIEGQRTHNVWLTVSPKPGCTHSALLHADEVKVILGGLGDGEGWMSVPEALAWQSPAKPVFIQPRNFKDDVDGNALIDAGIVVDRYPSLRLSVQLHKFLRVR